ncbi:MAG: SRPBCC family protein [Candidatus Limnocylindrales bacterium]
MHLLFEVDIESELETVFSWLADPERAMVWMTSVAGGEIIDRKPGMVGTTFRERVEEDGGGIEMHGSITAFEPNHRISFHLESRVNKLDVEYRIDAVGDVVRLTVASDIKWLFPVNLVSAFAGRTIKRKIVAQSNEEFGRLKQLCEGGGESRAV